MKNSSSLIDTNFFLRYLLNDVPTQCEEVKTIFNIALVEDNELFSTVAVFFEIDWVLDSVYELKKMQRLIHLNSVIFELPFIKFENHEIIKNTLALYQNQNIAIEDAYNIVYAKTHNLNVIHSFDKKLLKVFREYQFT